MIEAAIEHKLYWAAVRSLSEARYLIAVLNSARPPAAGSPRSSRAANGAPGTLTK